MQSITLLTLLFPYKPLFSIEGKHMLILAGELFEVDQEDVSGAVYLDEKETIITDDGNAHIRDLANGTSGRK